MVSSTIGMLFWTTSVLSQVGHKYLLWTFDYMDNVFELLFITNSIVWGTDLFIFYHISPAFGEMWTQFSYLQIVGMAILVYGTAVYNAPNAGCVLLEGQWYSFGIDCSKEYEAIRREQEEASEDAMWEVKQQEFKVRKISSFMESPRVSVHTQALRGLGAQHN